MRETPRALGYSPEETLPTSEMPHQLQTTNIYFKNHIFKDVPSKSGFFIQERTTINIIQAFQTPSSVTEWYFGISWSG